MENIIGSSPEMQDVFEMVRQAAPTQANVLVQGEIQRWLDQIESFGLHMARLDVRGELDPLLGRT